MGRNTEIFIAGASDRAIGVQRVLNDVNMSVFSGTEIALKANYNSADPPPASTHIDTLDAVCTVILAEKPKKLTLAERSGMGNTRGVLEDRGVIELAQEKGFSAVVLDNSTAPAGERSRLPRCTGSAVFLLRVFLPRLTEWYRSAASRHTGSSGISRCH